jgi:FMN phosphatase YigB (HAD superfamily)
MSFPNLSNEVPSLGRKRWAAEVAFSPLSEGEVLSLVLDEVLQFRILSREGRPVVFLDLDSTLYEVTHRTFSIYQEWHLTNRRALPSSIEEAMALMGVEDIGYSPLDTFANLQLDLESEEVKSAIQQLRDFWFDRFFTDEYLVHDRPYAKSVEYAKALHEAGARLVYLTGRERGPMQAGTIRNLKRDGFPMDESTLLLMRENPFFDDAEHKIAAVKRWAHRGTPVASFENEPRNLVALRLALPEAKHIFVDTVCSDKAAPIVDGFYRISGFHHFQG